LAADPAAVTTQPTPSSTVQPATTAAATTSTSRVPAEVAVSLESLGDPDPALEAAVEALYARLADPTGGPVPDLPDGLAELLDAAGPAGDLLVRGEYATATLTSGESVGVAVSRSDVVLLVDDGAGWRVVGARLEAAGGTPWYGEPVRRVLALGTDARPGQDQQGLRADSIHLLASAIGGSAGTILGFPRDSYVEAPNGRRDKFTHMNVYFGPETMVEVAERLSGLEIEGYLITGFLGFQQLVDAFGGVPVDVPFGMAEPKSQAYLNAGLQLLWGANALAFSRNRTIPNGDFRRSLHQGMVLRGALGAVQDLGVLALPSLLEMLLSFTWTDLDAEALLTIAAGAYEIEDVANVVLPGSVQTIGGASVVVLSEDAPAILADLEDGIVDVDALPGGALIEE
jgi:LCP family protein required for cell wall assembly